MPSGLTMNNKTEPSSRTGQNYNIEASTIQYYSNYYVMNYINSLTLQVVAHLGIE